MTEDEALSIVMDALNNLNSELDPSERIEPSADTVLFGVDAAIDSLSLVSVIVDVEEGVSDAVGHPVSLTDDDAISRKDSPFFNPRALARYIAERTRG